MAQLHPGARWTFRTESYSGAGVWIGILTFIGLGWLHTVLALPSGIPVFLTMVIISIGLLLIVGEAYARLSYRSFSYEFTDTHLSVSCGIIWKKNGQIPYERVQDVMIQRGIMARWLGFSELFVNTAGTSGFEGYLPGIGAEESEKLRDFLVKKAQEKNQGL